MAFFLGTCSTKKNFVTNSLRKTMINKKLMVEDDELFQKVKESRIYDKDFHIHALRQSSKNYKNVKYKLDFSVLMDDVFMRTAPRGISLSGSYLVSEPEEKTETKCGTSRLDKVKRRYRSRQKDTSYTDSEIEESTYQTASSEKLESENTAADSMQSETKMTTPKISKLKNLLNRKKQYLESNKTSDSEKKETFSEVESEVTGRSLPRTCKSKNADDANSENSREIDTKASPKLLKEKNVMFLPGGVRSMTKSSTKSKSSSSHFSDSTLSVDSKRARISEHKNKEYSSKNEMSDIEKKNVSNGEKRTSLSDADWNQPFVKSGEGNSASASNMVVKPFCSCKECKHWTTSEDWRRQAEEFDEDSKIIELKIARPPSLLLKKKREEDVKLSSVNYKAMSKLQKQASFKVLVHGQILPIPVDRVTEAPFHPVVHSSLKKLEYLRAKKIQSYIWPAITRSMNVCYVHRKNTGKTMAYLPPLCSFLLEKDERYEDLKKGGPIATILCSNSTQCEEIYDLANKLMAGAGYIKPRVLIVSYPFDHVNMSTLDLLITLPSVLIELLKKNATNFKRLCHLVLEDCSALLDKFSEEINTILGVVESMLSHRVIKQTVQMILTSEHWTLQLDNFVKKLRDIPLIAIGDYLEAGLYGRIKLKIKCIELKSKRDAVIDILQDKWKFFKSIIICNTEEEIELLKTSLDLASISLIAITSNVSKEEILQQEANWELSSGGNYKVLICTDQVLHSMLSITSATLVVHYSLPGKWTLLTKRFMCLLENYKSPLISDNNKLACEGHILSDEFCEAQMPRLISLLKNYNIALNKFEPNCQQIIIEKELSKISEKVPLCQSLKQFGFCHTNSCSKRHILKSELDECSSLPKNGTIKFKIIKLVDVNCLKVNIMEATDIEGRKIDINSQKGLDDHHLTSILTVNRIKANEIHEGESYAYWDSEEFDDVFRECIVEENKNEMVNILVKENCRRMIVCKNKLFQIPEEMKKDSTKLDPDTELIVANFKPPYKDEQFSARAFRKLSHIIENLSYDDNLFVANICLQLGNTIWVNNITEEVNVYDLSLCKTNLTKELVKQKLAEPNPDHLRCLYELCADADIVLPKYNIPVRNMKGDDESQVIPQWAFLEVENFNNVYFSSAISPEEIYVRQEKFNRLLIDLEKDIADVVRRMGSKRHFAIIPGKFYLAKDREENKFARVFIKKIEDGKALCFSVDYGDEIVVDLEDIRYLSNHLIQKLPFQAIQCRLYGIKSIDGEWPAEAIDVLYDRFSLETDSHIYRTLYAKCVCYDKGDFRGQSKFSILLKDAYEKPIIINQLLVDCGWADMYPNITLNDFEIYVEKPIESEDEILAKDRNDEDLEEMREIFETTEMVASNNVESVYEPPCASMDIECFFGEPDQEEEQFINFMNALVKAAEEKRALSSSVDNALPAIEAAPFEVDYCTPDVYWCQTKQTVELHIKLPNVETYQIKLDKSRIFSFQTKMDKKKYCLNLMLYETVQKKFSHTLGGLEIKVTLKKQEELEWPKLSRSKKRLRNVHYMLSKEEMQDENKKLFLDLGEEFKCESTSDEEAPMFTVVSDLDSEFDMDLEDDSDAL